MEFGKEQWWWASEVPAAVCLLREREREGLGVASSVFSLDFIVERRFSLGGPLDLPIDKPQKPSQ